VLPAVAMLQAAKDAEPRRERVLEAMLNNRDEIVDLPILRNES
jgi:hypothetical protein